MRAASPELAAHLAGEVTTLATCWRIVRLDGAEFFFTDHDVDLSVDGDLYLASVGYSRTAISSSASFAPANLDVEGLFDDGSLEEEELRAGLFDNAEVFVFLVNFEDLSQGVLRLRRGRFGEVTLGEDGMFRTELRGLAQALSQRIGELYSPECRADLGDARCKVAIATAAFTRPGEVVSVVSRSVFTVTIDTPAPGEGWYSGGVLIWTSGANAGSAQEVKKWIAADSEVRLFLSPAFAVEVGDEFDIRPGCDKRFATCRDKFDNVLNFRGEPYVPGFDRIVETPDAG